jgi:endogenous inhibitor of DNA gyrase (YacG/DUF329 family)
MEIRCPVCKKMTQWESNKWRPFCSERCKMTDLGAWASGEYYIAGDKKEEDESGTEGKKEDLKVWSE